MTRISLDALERRDDFINRHIGPSDGDIADMLALVDEPDAARRWLSQLGDPYTYGMVDLDGRVGIDWGV